jgi:sec-independent protein translocase protein TatB
MFDIGYSELLLIAIVTLLVVGPKELPNLLRTIGRWTGRARSMARHFRSGFDAMVREAEIEEMNKQWAAHNQAIMASTPDLTDLPEPERDADLEAIADLPPPLPTDMEAAPASPVAEPPAKPKRPRLKKSTVIPPAP